MKKIVLLPTNDQQRELIFDSLVTFSLLMDGVALHMAPEALRNSILEKEPARKDLMAPNAYEALLVMSDCVQFIINFLMITLAKESIFDGSMPESVREEYFDGEFDFLVEGETFSESYILRSE